MGQDSNGFPPISDYALIGNCRTAALIARDGSIDWYCPERFDWPAVFARLLDREKGGYLNVTAAGAGAPSRRYLPDTNILETTYKAGDGEAKVIDFMPMEKGSSDMWQPKVTGESRIVRRVQGVKGKVTFDFVFKPTKNYGLEAASVEQVDGGLVADCGDVYMAVHGDGFTFHDGDDGVWTARVEVGEGDCLTLNLVSCVDREGTTKAAVSGPEDGGFERTNDFWKKWSGTCTYKGPYRDEVVRSALALKLLTYDPTGAVVAAPTTSLPEEIGGVRNWDYRYTWLRDSSLILYALLTIGYDDSAVHFMSWLKHVVGRHLPENPQIMYKIDGGKDIPETELTALSGYRDSKPVRVGNAAAKQTQLDIYGEVMASAYIHYHRPEEGETPASDIQGETPADDVWALLTDLVDEAVQHWKEPDAGIWEVRGGPRDFVYSKLMCWVAVDRGVRIAEEHHLKADLDTWKKTRDEIRHAIETKGYNDKIGAFVQSFGSSALDSSVLAIPRMGFLPATDKRVTSTIDVIMKELTKNDLVYRYKSEDGLPGGEGSFLLCTFWLVDALALAGRLDDARRIYEHAISFKNDLGLFSEEIDANNGVFLGNFPQGFTHLSLVRSAVDLAKVQEHGAEHHAETEGQRVHKAHRAASSPHGKPGESK